MSHRYYEPRPSTHPARAVQPIVYKRSTLERHGELIVVILGAAVFGFAMAFVVIGVVIL